MKKRDLILLLSVIAVALLATVALWLTGAFGAADKVIVTVDGEVYREFPLDEDTEYRIETENGGYNILIIKDGEAFVSEASCPDKVCVNTGAAQEIKPVVCLPNKVVISIEKG